jgi:alkylated DNA nucleotide flippase Atl1
MLTDEERVYEVLQQLGGYATSGEIAKRLGWDTKGGARRVGQIMGRLMQRGRVERFNARSAYRIRNGSA